MAQGIRFEVLGDLRLVSASAVHVLRGPKTSKLLALLILRANQVVDVDSLIDELWDERPPRHAVSTVRSHVYHLRRLLADRLSAPVGDLLVTEGSGYALVLPEDAVDAARFSVLATEARRLHAKDRPAEAADLAVAALAMWRGPALANVRAGRLLEGHARRLEELRVQTLTVRVEAEVALGRHHRLLPELRELVAHHPLIEAFHVNLIEVLLRCERRADALLALQALHALLDRELGLAPSARLRELERRIAGGPGLVVAG